MNGASESVGSTTAGLGAALQAFVGLAIVIGLIITAAYVLKRLQPGRFGTSNLLKPVASLALGARERVVVVEMGDQWLVLGVTTTSITALHTGAKGTLPQAGDGTPIPLAQSFGALLARTKQHHGKS